MVTPPPRRAPRARTEPAATEPPAAEAEAEAGKDNPLRAGLKALGKVRDDVVQHQSRVFEAILGLDPGAGWSGLVKRDGVAAKAAQDALGLRKFEAVFDQRVLHALERLGLPSIDALQALGDELAAQRAELKALRAELEALKKKKAAPAAPPKATPRKR
ncbi:MAG: poly granule associated family protein [Pseudomonadota bacterium]